MPYIKQEDREKYENEIHSIVSKLVVLGQENENEVYGNLNYIFYSIIKRYLTFMGLRYFRLNGIIGMIECLKSEMYRVIVGPYEIQAIDKNGDIEPINCVKDK